jgi:hypothetical protein
MKKAIIGVCFVLAFGCSGGGGGGAPAPAPDLGTAPAITLGFFIVSGDPGLTPIVSANIGSDVQLYLCLNDPDLDAETIHVTQYLLPDTINPYTTSPLTLTKQTQANQCYISGPIIVEGPAGNYEIVLEADDSKGNTSAEYSINNLSKIW